MIAAQKLIVLLRPPRVTGPAGLDGPVFDWEALPEGRDGFRRLGFKENRLADDRSDPNPEPFHAHPLVCYFAVPAPTPMRSAAAVRPALRPKTAPAMRPAPPG